MISNTKFNFGSIVIVEENLVGVVVKSWSDETHEVYVRSFNSIKTYREKDMKKFIYDKELSDEDMEYYR